MRISDWSSDVCSSDLLSVEFPGGANGECVARVAFGLELRSWRMDAYRTRLSDKQKPTLTDVTLVSDAPSTGDAWQRLSALADGVKFTRELVAEPANILYPESFRSEEHTSELQSLMRISYAFLCLKKKKLKQ